MFKYLILIVAVFCFASATEFSQCKKYDAPLRVDVKGCDKQPCAVVKGTEAVMDMQFVTKNDNTTTLTAKVTAYSGMLAIPYPIDEQLANVCANLLDGANCPLDANEVATYRIVFSLDDSYPEITVKFQVALEDQDKNIVSCFAVNVQILKEDIGAVGQEPEVLALK